MKTIPTPSFFFFRTNSKNGKLNSSLQPYPKRALVAVIIAIPFAFGLNMPLNSIASFMPIWGVIIINAILIPSYMTFMIPKASKLAASWLSPKQKSSPDLIPEIQDMMHIEGLMK